MNLVRIAKMSTIETQNYYPSLNIKGTVYVAFTEAESTVTGDIPDSTSDNNNTVSGPSPFLRSQSRYSHACSLAYSAA